MGEINAQGKANAAPPVSPTAVPHVDIEDLCTLCEDLPEPEAESDAPATTAKKNATPATAAAPGTKQKMKQTTLFGMGPGAEANTTRKGTNNDAVNTPSLLTSATAYARQFPRKAVKQNVRVEVRLVCILRLHATPSEAQPDDSRGEGTAPLFLVQQRPDKGLLASLWEFPTAVVPDEGASDLTEKSCREHVQSYLQGLSVPSWEDSSELPQCTIQRTGPVQMLGRVKHTFSHLQWDMWVCLVDMVPEDLACSPRHPDKKIRPDAKWLSFNYVESVTMGTGLRRCWALVPTHA